MRFLDWLQMYVRWLFSPDLILKQGRANPFVTIPGWESVFLVGSADAVENARRVTGTVFLGGEGNAFLEPLLGSESVFLLDGEQHKLARSIIRRSLSLPEINKRLSYINECVEAALVAARQKGTVNLGVWCRKLTMSVILNFAFNETDVTYIRRTFRRFEHTTGILANFVIYNKANKRSQGALPVRSLVRYVVRRVDTVVYESIEDARGRSFPPDSNRCLLDYLLLEQKARSYDDQFIRDNLVAFIAAGYETTAAALSWMFFWLSRAEDEVLRALMDEVDTHSREDIDKCVVLESFAKETLRYCTPIEILPRKIAKGQLAQADIILSDARFSRNANGDTLICPCPHIVHHDSDLYPNPEIFDHTRFLSKKYGPGEFFPFGSGERLCLGVNLGLLTMKLVLFKLLECNSIFRLRNRVFAPVRRNVTLWPAYALSAQLKDIRT